MTSKYKNDNYVMPITTQKLEIKNQYRNAIPLLSE